MLAHNKGRGMFRLLCLLVCALLLSTQAVAAENGSLTLHYSRGNTEFQLYLVAEPSDGSYTFTDDFTGCGVALPDTGSSNSQLQAAAQKLAKYVDRENISETRSGRVSGGSVTFSSLEEGWYLVTGDSYTVGDTRYTPIPFLVYVDGSETANAKADGTTPGTIPDDPDEPKNPDDPDTPDNPDIPNQPGEPDVPGEPDQPGNPNIPDKPGVPDEPNSPDDPGVPQTSDASLTWLWSGICLLSLTGLVLLYLTGRGKGPEQ